MSIFSSDSELEEVLNVLNEWDTEFLEDPRLFTTEIAAPDPILDSFGNWDDHAADNALDEGINQENVRDFFQFNEYGA